MPNLVEISLVVLEKEAFKDLSMFLLIRNYPPFEKDKALLLNKLEFSLLEVALC